MHSHTSAGTLNPHPSVVHDPASHFFRRNAQALIPLSPSVRVLAILVLALLVAGCLKEGPREARLAPEGCARLSVTPDLVALAPGERAIFTVRLENVCREPFDIQRSDGCEQDGLDAHVLREGKPWPLTGGAAVDIRTCSADMGRVVEVGPGEHVEREFGWNGTFWRMDCGAADCPAPEQAAPGAYRVSVFLAMPGQTARATADVHVR